MEHITLPLYDRVCGGVDDGDSDFDLNQLERLFIMSIRTLLTVWALCEPTYFDSESIIQFIFNYKNRNENEINN